MTIGYVEPTPEQRMMLRQAGLPTENMVVLPEANTDGSARDFGLLEDLGPTPPIAFMGDDKGYVDMTTGKPVPAPSLKPLSFQGTPMVDTNQVGDESPKPKSKSKNKTPRAPKTGAPPSPPSSVPAPALTKSKTVFVHAPGMRLPFAYRDVLVDQARSLIVLVSDPNASRPTFERLDESGPFKLTIDETTHLCGCVGIEYTFADNLHEVLVLLPSDYRSDTGRG